MVAAGRVAEDFPVIGEPFMPGRHINDHQKRLLMKHRQNDGVAVAAAKAGLSTATGYRLEKARSAPQEHHFQMTISKFFVLFARDRAGATIDAVLPKLDRASVTAVLSGVVTPANQLCCDDGKAIAAFARVGGIPYHVLPKPGGPKPEAPDWHINNVNAYHSRLKEWLRPFHGVATKNLSHYLGWRRTLEAFGHEKEPGQWLNSALGSGAYQQVTL